MFILELTDFIEKQKKFEIINWAKSYIKRQSIVKEKNVLINKEQLTVY